MNKFSYTEKNWDGTWSAYCTDGWSVHAATEERAKELLEDKLKRENE